MEHVHWQNDIRSMTLRYPAEKNKEKHSKEPISLRKVKRKNINMLKE